MKLKTLISILLLPISAFAANTNVFDRVLIRNDFQFTGGVVAAGKVLTSDAAGNFTPQPAGGATGPFAVTNASNEFTIASTNNFNALTTSSNLLVRGRVLINGTNVTTGLYGLMLRPVPGFTSTFMQINDSGLGGSVGIEYNRGIRSFEVGNDGADNFRINMNGSGSFDVRDDGVYVIRANDSGITFGTSSSFTETYNGITVTRPNGWLVNGFAPATVIVTNIQADFPSILAATFADLTFPVSNTSSNMVISIGSPTLESGSLSVNAFVSAIGTVTLRARNVGSLAVDQVVLPYRLQITASPTANSP